MLRKNRLGFTLIELMVVIVIIGVLAALAIPRFTEASDKAKVAEAPRILSSFESAFLAAVAERGANNLNNIDDLIFNAVAVNNDSRWFEYNFVVAANTGTGTAVPQARIGGFGVTELEVDYDVDEDQFNRTSTSNALANRYVPNFLRQ